MTRKFKVGDIVTISKEQITRPWYRPEIFTVYKLAIDSNDVYITPNLWDKDDDGDRICERYLELATPIKSFEKFYDDEVF